MSQAEQALILAQRSEIERLRLFFKPSRYYWKFNESTLTLLLIRHETNDYGVLLYSSPGDWFCSVYYSVEDFHPRIVDNRGNICSGGVGTRVHLWSTSLVHFRVYWTSREYDCLLIQIRGFDTPDVILSRDDALQLIAEFCAILRDHRDASQVNDLETLAKFEQACRKLGANS